MGIDIRKQEDVCRHFFSSGREQQRDCVGNIRRC